MAEAGVARFRKEVAAARKDDPEWYNDDGNFLVGVKGVQRATRLALGVVKEIRLELVKELREQGATHAEVLLEGEDAWIVEDKEWAAAVGSKDELLKGLGATEEGRLRTRATRSSARRFLFPTSEAVRLKVVAMAMGIMQISFNDVSRPDTTAFVLVKLCTVCFPLPN